MSLTNLVTIKISSISSEDGKTNVLQNISLGLMTIGFFYFLFISFWNSFVLDYGKRFTFGILLVDYKN